MHLVMFSKYFYQNIYFQVILLENQKLINNELCARSAIYTQDL